MHWIKLGRDPEHPSDDDPGQRDDDPRERDRDPRDHVLESITGHLSRRTLEHYSHIRIDAKRQALDALDVQCDRVLPEAGNAHHPTLEFVCVDGEASRERVAANGAALSGAEPFAVTNAFRRAPDGADRGQDPRSGGTSELRNKIEAIIDVPETSRHNYVTV